MEQQIIKYVLVVPDNGTPEAGKMIQIDYDSGGYYYAVDNYDSARKWATYASVKQYQNSFPELVIRVAYITVTLKDY